MNRSERDELIRTAKVHEDTADEYAKRSHEMSGEMADAYSEASEAHNHIARLLRIKTNTSDPTRG